MNDIASRPTAAKPVFTTDMPKPDGIRDTIESIVVAFILAFVFRAFVVEAFVIPTGSMAPGLHGKHAQHRCGVCNYSFSYGIRESILLPQNRLITGTLENKGGFFVRCPNCGWNGDGNDNLNTSSETRITGDSGDRILVLKWPYDVGGALLGPKRWDVVVFKDPQDGETNFIKRLIGLPGEVLELIDGDVYAAPAKDIPADIRDALSKPPTPGNSDFRRLNSDQELRLAKSLTIQRKTKIAQESLWILHYNHDFKPDLSLMQTSPGFHPPYWHAKSGDAGSDWDASTPVIRFTPKSDTEQWIELVGRPIQDQYAYNDVSMIPSNPINVGDVRLKFVLFPELAKMTAQPTDGSLMLALRKGFDEFDIRIQTDGTVIMERPGERGIKRELDRGKTNAFATGKPIEVEYENLDYRVSLRINGEEVIATKDSDYSPNMRQLLERPYRDGRYSQAAVMIGAKNLPLELRHVAVHRDVFYRSDCELDSESPAGRHNPYARYPGWGTATNPILLRDGPPDYFCCGDNSPQSKDSRMWSDVSPLLIERGDYQNGTVPGDQMIGQAFFVYWPSGYRFSADTPAVIPNVGRMRIIR
ncbi:MAG: S26 family signal peptidase [Planctomycetota bacterium]